MKNIGKYGSIAIDFFKEKYPKEFEELSKEEIEERFSKVNEKVHRQVEMLMNQFLKKDPIKDPNNFLERVQHINQIKAQAEEIAIHNIIYKDN